MGVSLVGEEGGGKGERGGRKWDKKGEGKGSEGGGEGIRRGRGKGVRGGREGGGTCFQMSGWGWGWIVVVRVCGGIVRLWLQRWGLDRDVGVGFCLAGRERGSGCCVMNLRLLGGGTMC